MKADGRPLDIKFRGWRPKLHQLEGNPRVSLLAPQAPWDEVRNSEGRACGAMMSAQGAMGWSLSMLKIAKLSA